jgi:hypothetical protein
MTHTDLIFLILGNALWICGVWHAALPCQILDPIATWMAGNSKSFPPMEGHVPEWINKPLLTCPICMASVHGTAGWFVFGQGPLWHWPIYVVALSGLMEIVALLILDRQP